MLPLFISLFVVGMHGLAVAEPPGVRETETEKRQLLFRRLEAIVERELSDTTETGMVSTAASEPNAASLRQWTRALFDEIYIHSSFGLYWDEIPPPTIRGPEATKGVERFVADHGWNMGTNMLAICYTLAYGAPISGLPWAAIHDREFRATTLDGVLVVAFHGSRWSEFPHSGVAYNPTTNRMPPYVSGKHLGDHWYAWRLGGEPTIYEGQERTGQPDGTANRSQPIRAETNRTSVAAGSDR